jgi:NADH:ubiquinone oxidoreductase subunit 2 (subunit N)
VYFLFFCPSLAYSKTLNSTIIYYFKIIINTFTGEPKNNSEVPIVEGTQKLLLIVGIVLLIVLGLAPEMIVRWH